MASPKTAILALGAGVLALIGAGLFFAMNGELDGGGGTPDEVAIQDAGAPARDEGSSTTTRRPQKKGSAGLFGTVQFRKDEKPAAGQEVVLSTEGVEPWKVRTDEKGLFEFKEIPRGGPYEVSVTADKYAKIRLPGIGLDRDETRDLGTLWLDAAVSVTVYVKTYQDKPIAGAEVSAFASAQASGTFDWNQRLAQLGTEPVANETLTTDDQGKVVFRELSTGNWTFTAGKSGFARDGQAAPAFTSKKEPQPVTIYLGKAFRLAGRVLDGSESPVAGALVMAAPNRNYWGAMAAPLYARTQADEQGRYAFDDLASGDTQIWAARPGGIPSKVATLSVPPIEEFDLRLIAGGVLTGKVTLKETGSPVEGATVRATGWSNGGQRVALATTDAEGRYVIDTLLEGTINSLAVEKDDFVQFQEQGQQWQQIPINRDDRIERDLVMEKAARLSGTVFGPDGPVAQASVVVMSFRNNNWDNKSTTTDAKGHFEFKGVQPGQGMLQVGKPGLYQKDFPQNAWMALQSGNPPEQYTVEIPAEGKATKDIRLVAGTAISGYVRMADGSSAEGVRVTAGGVNATAGADGRFEVAGVTPGQQVHVAAFHEGYAGEPKLVQVKEDEPNTDLELTLHKAGTVTGTVRSARSAELADAYVQIQPVADNNNRNDYWMIQQMQSQWANTQRVPVREDGTYEIPMPYAAGKFQIRAVALGHQDGLSDPVDVVPGQEQYLVDVSLDEGVTLRGRVLLKNTAQGVAGAQVQLRANGNGQGGRFNGFMPWGWNGNGQTIAAVSGSDGTFEIPNQAPGNYAITATAEGHVAGNQTFKLPEGNDVDVFIEEALEITGFVQLADGTPVEGCRVTAQSADKANGTKMRGPGPGRIISDGVMYDTGGFGPGGVAGTAATTGSDGAFRIQKLPSGNYKLIVTPANNWMSKVNIRTYTSDPVAAGTEGHRLTVQAGLTISGKVVDPDNKPVSGVYVNINPNPHKPGMMNKNAMTKSDGTFEAVGLIEGTYKLTVQAGWGGAQDLTGAERDGVTAGEKELVIKLERGMTITGTVLGVDGQPASNKTVNAQWQPDPNDKTRRRPPTMGWKMAATDANGRFEIQGLAPGLYRLNVGQMFGNSNGEEMVVGNATFAAGAQNVQVALGKALSIAGQVVDENGSPLKNVNVRAQPKGGGNNLSARTNEQGEFELKNVSPGVQYTVTAQRNGSAPAELQDVAGGATGLRLSLARGQEITGRLLDADGNPSTRTYIQVTTADNKSRQGTNTDEDGNFTVSGLIRATYTLKAYVRKRNDDGSRTAKWFDLGTVEAPASNVELRMPSQ